MKVILERIKQRYNRKVELKGLIDVASRRVDDRGAVTRRGIAVTHFVICDCAETAESHHKELERLFLREAGFCPIYNSLLTELAILKIELSRHTWYYILTGRDD